MLSHAFGVACLLVVWSCATGPAPTGSFHLEETTISNIQTALADGSTTCTEIVQGYLDRITAYDKTGPALNALVVVAGSQFGADVG